MNAEQEIFVFELAPCCQRLLKKGVKGSFESSLGSDYVCITRHQVQNIEWKKIAEASVTTARHYATLRYAIELNCEWGVPRYDSFCGAKQYVSKIGYNEIW